MVYRLYIVKAARSAESSAKEQKRESSKMKYSILEIHESIFAYKLLSNTQHQHFESF